jgi:hypothetical protein
MFLLEKIDIFLQNFQKDVFFVGTLCIELRPRFKMFTLADVMEQSLIDLILSNYKTKKTHFNLFITKYFEK